MKIKLIILLSILMVFPACLEPDDPAEKRAALAEKSRGDILVGAVASWSAMDGLLWSGMEMAVDEINARGGLLGRKIVLVKRDDEGKVEKGIQIAQEFADNPHMTAVIGHYQSFVTIPASVIYQYYGILLLSTVATDPKLTREGFSLVFRTVPDDNAFCTKLAEFCAKRGYRQFLLYHDATQYGRSLGDAFEIANEKAGIAVLDRQSYNDFTTLRDFRKVLMSWKRNYSFDAVFVAGNLPKAGIFIKTARALGVHKPILGGLALDHKELLSILDPTTTDVFMPTTFNVNSPEKQVRKFVAAFKKRYGKAPHTLAALAYDTVHALADAIKRARSTSPPAMAKALLSGKGFKGLTGFVRFNARGKRLGTDISVKMVKEGRFVYLPSEGE